MNKVIVISGASSGIGLELIKNFTQNGDTAICLSRSNKKSVPNFIECDVSSETSIKMAVQQIAEKYGRIDMLINNAGLGISGATELLSLQKIEQVMDTVYYGTLMLSRVALPLMPRGSKIINISSVCAVMALPFRGVYCSSKAAVNMLSFSMRMELSSSGVNVVCICPGDIKTNFTANRIKEFETNERYGERIKNMANKLDFREDKRMNCEKASKKIFKICKNKNKAMYIVGAKYKVLFFLSKILPTNFFVKMTGKLFG